MTCPFHKLDIFAFRWTDPRECIACSILARAYYDQFQKAVLEISIRQHAALYYDQFLGWHRGVPDGQN